jgi:ribosomal protein S18 acetylase RimI-like enzyme
VSTPEWTIRQATVGELERLVDLRLAMFDAMGLLDEENRERTRDDCRAYFEATLPSEEFRVWVAVVFGADIVGTEDGASSDEIGTCGGKPATPTGLADCVGTGGGASSVEIGTCGGGPAALTGPADCVDTGGVAGSGLTGTCEGESSALIEPSKGDPVASIGLVVHSVPPSPFNRVGREGYIMNLVTLPPLRRRGIARALLSHVIEVLRAEGVPVASLHATSDGRELYEELGFVLNEELPEMRLSL